MVLLNFHNMRNIYLLFFSIQRLWGKSLKIPGSVYIPLIFLKYDCMGMLYSGCATYLILGSNIDFFLGVIHF